MLKRPRKLVFPVTALWVLLVSGAPGSSWQFAEGYSSPEPGLPAAIYYRAFTIYIMQEACEASPVPAEMKVRPDPLRLNIGDRVARTERTALIIEAYNGDGRFIPAIPTIVDISDPDNIIDTRSDWDYLEAIAEGRAELTVKWACRDDEAQAVEATVPIVVESE